MAVDWLGFGYAALVASGGVIGYIKAGSVPSLAAGLLFGSAAGLGAYQITQDPKNIWMSLIASGALTGIMGMRFYNSGKFMPAGLVAGARLLREARLEITGALTKIFVYSLATGEVPKDCLLMLGRLGLKMFEKPHKS